MSHDELISVFEKIYPILAADCIRIETRTENSLFITVDKGVLNKYVFEYTNPDEYRLYIA